MLCILCRCKHYAYVDVTVYPGVRGENGYVRVGTERDRVQVYPDRGTTDDLGVPDMAYLSPDQVVQPH